MSDIKEDLINKITTQLVNEIGINSTEKLKNILALEFDKVEIINKEVALTVSPDERISIIKEFLACKKIAGLTDRSLRAYFDELVRFFKQINKNVKDVTTNDIRIYLAISQKTASNVTVDNRRRYLNTFFEWCLTEEKIQKNPVRRIEKVKVVKKEKEAFSQMEIEIMRNYLNTHKPRTKQEYRKETQLRNIAIFETLLSTGLRCTELSNIKKAQVEKGEDEIIVLGKGQKERKVYLNPKSKLAIENYIKQRKDNNEYLFITHGMNSKPQINRIGTCTIEEMIRKSGKHCNIEAYPHKFRRTTATNAVKKGMPIEQVQKLLGHSSLNTTQIYVQVSNDDVKKSIERIM